MDKTIKDYNDLLLMLDSKFRPAKQFWNPFYSVRERQVPFFRNAPDENLVSYVDRKIITSGRALDLGCGPGRNAIYLAQIGFEVDAYDLSEEAITWAKERAVEKKLSINFECRSVFELSPIEEYDLVYDSGCLHHLLPHRRIQYLEMIFKAIKSGGYFGITCFRPGFGDIGGPVREMTDWEVYEEGTMNGGLAFSEEKIKYLLSSYFECIEFRALEEQTNNETFGVPFLWASLWKKN